MADIRISAGDLRKMEDLNRQIQGGAAKLSPRVVEEMVGDISGKIKDGVGKILANLDNVYARLGVDRSSATGKGLRVGLETVEGASGAVDAVAPFLPLLAATPQARLAMLAATAVVGALEGLSREHLRRLAVETEKAEQAVRRAEQRWIRSGREAEERIKAAMKAGARLR